MKKIIYILFAALLGAVSCTVNGPEVPQPQDGKVTILMNVTFPEVLVNTKGTEMAETPNIDNIYVATFGNNHYLNDYVKAIPCDADGRTKDRYDDDYDDELSLQNGKDFWFKVTLSATTSKRFVHVFANGPSSLDFGYEDDIMKNLTTTDPTGSYWTYLVLPNGTATIDPETGAASASEEAKGLFSNLKLIRNFAKVKLDIDLSVQNFELTGYKVFNTPSTGSVAVWSADQAGQTDSGNSGYFNNYWDYEMDDLLEDYEAFMPAGTVMKPEKPGDLDNYDKNEKYVYERPDRESDRPFIIMKGKFKDGNNWDTNDTYYKLVFEDSDGNYLPIYRNQEYRIHLTAIAKRGEESAALARVSNANVSSLIETGNLSDLSDGTSRIQVEWLDKAFMEESTVTLRYHYLRDATNEESASKASLSIISGAGSAIAGATADDAFISHTGPDANGWCTITFKTTAPGTTEKVTKFRITGETLTTPSQKLFREINVRVLPFQPWIDKNASASDGKIIVTLTLPTGLPSSIFPLEIAFEDNGHVLDPVGDDMPTALGESIVPGKTGVNSYQFVKTVGFFDYNPADGGSNVVTCEFERIKTGPSTLYFTNPYFLTTGNSVSVPN